MSEQYLRGVLGYKGERGYSAYEIALQNGFIGTEKEWLSQLGTSKTFKQKKEVYTSTANQTIFDISSIYVSNDFVDVYVNGYKLNANEYEVDIETIQVKLLGLTLEEGQTVEIVTTTTSLSELPIVTTLTASANDETILSAKAVLDNLPVNVKHFGAKGDGVTDDTEAIQRAINENPNGTIYIPDGIYLVSDSINVSYNQKLVGCSMSDTILKFTADEGSLIDISSKNHIDIENLSLMHDFEIETVGVINTAKAIHADSCPYTRYKNLIIKGFDYGIDCSDNSWCTDLENVTVQTCNYGFYANGEFNNCSFIKYRSTYCKYGAYIGAGRTVGFTDCQFEKNETGLSKLNLGDATASSCYFEGNKQDIYVSWGMSAAYKVSIVDCSFFKGSDQATDDLGCIHVHGDNKTLILIKNCSFTKNGDDSFRIIDFHSGTTAKVIVEDNYLQDGYTIVKEGKTILNYSNLIVKDSFSLNKSLKSFRHSHTPEFLSTTDGVAYIDGNYDGVRVATSIDVTIMLPETNDNQNSFDVLVVLEPGKSVTVKKTAEGDVINNASTYTNDTENRQYKMGKIVFLVARESGNEYALVWY